MLLDGTDLRLDLSMPSKIQMLSKDDPGKSRNAIA